MLNSFHICLHVAMFPMVSCSSLLCTYGEKRTVNCSVSQGLLQRFNYQRASKSQVLVWLSNLRVKRRQGRDSNFSLARGWIWDNLIDWAVNAAIAKNQFITHWALHYLFIIFNWFLKIWATFLVFPQFDQVWFLETVWTSFLGKFFQK